MVVYSQILDRYQQPCFWLVNQLSKFGSGIYTWPVHNLFMSHDYITFHDLSIIFVFLVHDFLRNCFLLFFFFKFFMNILGLFHNFCISRSWLLKELFFTFFLLQIFHEYIRTFPSFFQELYKNLQNLSITCVPFDNWIFMNCS